MNYALVLTALERHLGICQRSLDFFRERRMGQQFQAQLAMLAEAQRAIAEVQKIRDMHEFQTDLWKKGLGEAPNPVPTDTSEEDLPASSADFPDKQLRCRHENLRSGPQIDGTGSHYAVCADCGKRM